MPTYDYRCTSCSHVFEAMQPITADPLKECPLCGGPVKRLVGGGIGLIFKGSGFYITDYGRKGGGGGNGKKKAPAEAAPAAKPDSPTPAGKADAGAAAPGKKADSGPAD